MEKHFYSFSTYEINAHPWLLEFMEAKPMGRETVGAECLEFSGRLAIENPSGRSSI